MTEIGAYVGTDPSVLTAYEQWLGRPVDNLLFSLNQTSWGAFDGSVGWAVNTVKSAHTPVIWSVPLTVNGSSLDQAATGAFDSHYLEAAQALAASSTGSGPIYVRVGWEFNLDQPWDARGHEQSFIQAYRDLVDTFRSVSSNFKFVWDPNVGGTYNPALAYPGDNYVDVIGADFYYNPQYDGTDAAAAFATKVSEQYGLQWQQDFAAAHGKPTAVSEWGVDTDGSGAYIAAAAQWFSDHNMLYENYWESDAAYAGELHTGAYPDAALAFQQAFGTSSTDAVAATAGAAALSGLTSGSVVADLAGGFVSQNGVVKASLSASRTVDLGSNATTVYGARSGSDSVVGGSGTLTFYGQGASDTIQGGTGAATINGGSGNETFTSHGGSTVMFGGTATNSMVGGSTATSQDTFYAKGGTDTVWGEGGAVTLYGSHGTETLYGGTGTNTLYGGSGVNTLVGSTNTTATGQSGENILYGGTGASAGTDLFYAGSGVNLLYEGSGTDYFASDAGTDSIFGGSGHSYVYGGTGTQSIYTGAGDQTITCGGGKTYFYDIAAHLTKGRLDRIDGFNGGIDTELFLPHTEKGATSFISKDGGTAIFTGLKGGEAEIFVADASVAAVKAHTHFTL